MSLWLLLAACDTPPEPEPGPEPEPTAAAPDIVLITIDTLRRDHLGVYGYELPTSPTIDALAARGAVFERAYAPTGWTAPSMTSLFTGVWPAQHGVEKAMVDARRAYDQPVLSPEHQTLAEALSEAGYTTFGVSTNGHVKRELGLAQGFDHWIQHSFVGTNDASLDAIRTWSGPLEAAEGPRFVWLHFMAPHAPYVERERFSDFQREGVDDRVAAYDSEVAYVDQGVAEALDLLGMDDAIVVLTSDHGELLGDPQGWGHGGIFEPLVRVPLVVAGPGVVPQRIDAGVSLVDIKLSLVELGGGASTPSAGQSFAGALAGEAIADRELLVTTRRGEERDGLLDGTTKATWTPERTSSVYDLATDPQEVDPQFQPEVVARAHARFTEMTASPAPTPPLPSLDLELSDAEYEKLRLLGYVD